MTNKKYKVENYEHIKIALDTLKKLESNYGEPLICSYEFINENQNLPKGSHYLYDMNGVAVDFYCSKDANIQRILMISENEESIEKTKSGLEEVLNRKLIPVE